MDSTPWQRFIRACLRRRLRKEKVIKLAEALSRKSPSKGLPITETLLTTRKSRSSPVDPLVIVYLDGLLEVGIVDTQDILSSLYSSWKRQKTIFLDVGEGSHDLNTRPDACINPELEGIVLEQLTRGFQSGKRPKTQTEVKQTLRTLSEWLSSVTTGSHSLLQPLEQQSSSLYGALGALMLAMLENAKVAGVVDTAMPKGTVSMTRSIR